MKKFFVISFFFIQIYGYPQNHNNTENNNSINNFETKNVTNNKYNRNSIGLSISSISSFGLNYKFQFDEIHHLKLTAGAWSFLTKDDNSDSDRGYEQKEYKVYSTGLEYQYSFIKMTGSRGYFLIGGSYWHILKSWDEKQKIFTFGTGLGFEIYGNEYMSFNIEFGFQRFIAYSYPVYGGKWGYGNNADKNSWFSPGLGIGINFY